MIYRTYVPRAPLGEFVDFFWYFAGHFPAHAKERVFPHGCLELIIDLQTGPRRWFDREDHSRFREYRRGWLSGAHSEYIVIETTKKDSSMLGIHFKPGGAHPFFDLPVSELNEQVVELDQLWGAEAGDLRDRLLETPEPADKFAVLEKYLLRRGRRTMDGDNPVAFALRAFEQTPHEQTIASVANRLGVSHKHLIEQFRRRVGFTPKLYCRIRRFQRVVMEIEQRKSIDWADLACACGYHDQAHFIRDFQAFSGLNPSAYLMDRSEYLNFVPIKD